MGFIKSFRQKRVTESEKILTVDNKNLLISQIQTDVSLVSFLSVISIFFIGALLPQFNSYDLSVKIPISFLILATFAFLFSGLILSNATHKVYEGNSRKVEKYLAHGYAISEYMGVFLFVLSVPLTISIITSDLYLKITTFFAAILGLSLYQLMGFSMLEEHFSRRYRLFAIITILFGVVLFISQAYAFYFTEIAVAFLIFILLITILAPIKSFQ